MRRARTAALALAMAGAALAVAATPWSLLLLDARGERVAFVVRRDASIGMRALDSARALCARQAPGSPLHSALIPASYCPLALAAGPWVAGERVLLRIPLPRT